MSATYTVQQAVSDWLEGGLQGRSEGTRSIYQEALKPLLEHIGAEPPRERMARDVRRGPEALSDTMSSRYLQIAWASLARAIRYAEAHDLVTGMWPPWWTTRRASLRFCAGQTFSPGRGGGVDQDRWLRRQVPSGCRAMSCKVFPSRAGWVGAGSYRKGLSRKIDQRVGGWSRDPISSSVA